MIYECFSFLNEFDMLELKLQEHYPYVDKFIITESNKNFNQDNREYILETQWERYKKYHDKIIYQKYDGNNILPGWKTERAQRSYLKKDIKFNKDDIIISSDCDEFLWPSDWEWIKTENFKDYKHVIRYLGVSYWGYADIKILNSGSCGALTLIPGHLYTRLDENRWDSPKTTKNSGVHLTWFGDKKSFEEKFKGIIETMDWTKKGKTNLESSWQDKLALNLFKHKVPNKKNKRINLNDNKDFTETMKQFISKKKEWLHYE
jgi:hypothetical protein